MRPPDNDTAPSGNGARVRYFATGFYPNVENDIRRKVKRTPSLRLDGEIDRAMAEGRWYRALVLGRERDRRLAIFLGAICIREEGPTQ